MSSWGDRRDTIAALATPPGEGAIAVIRISGFQSFWIAKEIFSGPVLAYESHTVHYGRILDREGHTLDTVLLFVMKGPRSYTGEDSVEISCHGGSLMARRLLARVFEAGARPAMPGEFSLRAFLNGKLDLAQAEAIQQLIAAKSELALRTAEAQLEGALSRSIARFQKELTQIAAILEAWVDFPEEGLEFASMEEISFQLTEICQRMERLRATFREGKIAHEGICLGLIGSPNVGKSSLMNALLGKDRAIVTDVAGTTRDLLEEPLKLGELHFRLVDTAGIRESYDSVEQEGIRRSRKVVEEADLLLLLLDASRPLSSEDQLLLQTAPRSKTVLVWNKIDLKQPEETISWEPSVLISAKEGRGIEDLKGVVTRWIWRHGAPSQEELIITQERHEQALGKAIASCCFVMEGLKQGTSAEFVVSDLRSALYDLASILGTNVSEDILTEIFRRFCLGK